MFFFLENEILIGYNICINYNKDFKAARESKEQNDDYRKRTQQTHDQRACVTIVRDRVSLLVLRVLSRVRQKTPSLRIYRHCRVFKTFAIVEMINNFILFGSR